MNPTESYRSPLESRYASAELRAIWSPQRKFSTWLALAEAQRELGLDISREQIDELRSHLDDIDFDAAARYEDELHHDVMAHIYALGDVAPGARPIVHLGATSQFVNCNTTSPPATVTRRRWASPTFSRPSRRRSASGPPSGPTTSPSPCRTWSTGWKR